MNKIKPIELAKRYLKPLLFQARIFVRSFWIIPLAFGLFGLILASVLIQIDQFFVAENPFDEKNISIGVLNLSTQSALSLLSAITSGMMSVATLVFSMTFVAVTLLSQQLGPRVLSLFISDRKTQAVMGVFIGTLIYALIAMTGIESRNGSNFVPTFTVAGAIGLCIFSILLVIYFINHMIQTIQADSIIASIGQDLKNDFEDLEFADPNSLYFERVKDSNLYLSTKSAIDEDGAVLLANKSAYIVDIHMENLIEICFRHQIFVELLVRTNGFQLKSACIANVHPANRLTDELKEEIYACIELREKRTLTGEGSYELDSLVEIGLRALSPGINDPYTAIAVLNQLGAHLRDRLQHESSAVLITDQQYVGRLIKRGSDFSFVLNTSFLPFFSLLSTQTLVISKLAGIYGVLVEESRNRVECELLAEHISGLVEIVENSSLPTVLTKEPLDVLTSIGTACSEKLG